MKSSKILKYKNKNKLFTKRNTYIKNVNKKKY